VQFFFGHPSGIATFSGQIDMTTKEIIAAFRSGQMREEEAVVRLTSLCRQKASLGDQAEAATSASSNGHHKNGVGSSQTVQSRPSPAALRRQSSTAEVSGAASAKNSDAAASCDIAVIGMAGRFPEADDVEEFWKNIVAGRDCVSEVPSSRWSLEKYYDPDPTLPGKSYSKWAGLVRDIDCFDPLFFSISPREAGFMDPQQRLFLQEAWRAFEDAGYAPNTLSETKCGVFVGASSGDYQFLLLESGIGTDAYVLLGSLVGILAGRIGYALNLKGPCLAIDTASSSSLVAVHHACQSIRMGESEIALAGGVAILATPHGHIITSKTGALARTGRCYTFDQRAEGFVPSEGVAAIVLKPLHKAIQDGDHIYGVIKGSGVNQDGSTNGITAPSAESQKNLQLQVYRGSGVDPSTVTYVECHGTGTKLGDPIEVTALTNTFRTYTNEKQFCALGSSKTNVGHALAACGIIGLVKTLCCLERKQIPASLHFNKPNPHIAFDDSPFFVNTKLRSWDVSKLPRRAAINSFGISGTNAHVVLEEYVPPIQEDGPEAVPDGHVVIPISARTEPQLKQYAGKMLEYIESASSQSEQNDRGAEFTKLRQIAYTMQTGRIALAHRLAMVVQNQQELKRELRAFIHGGALGPNVWIGTAAANGKPDLDAPGSDTEKPATLDQWIRIAKSWVAGRDVNWNAFYGTFHPRRVSLPTYPFAKERYWVPEAGSDISAHNKDRQFFQAALHPASNSELPLTSKQKPVPVPKQELLPARKEESLNVQSLLFLQEKPKLEEVEANIDWVREIEKHRGERLLFVYEREQDREAFVGLQRQFEGALNTQPIFQCSYVKLLEKSSSLSRPRTGDSVELDDPAQVRKFLESFKNASNVPDAFFFVPAQRSIQQNGGAAQFFFMKMAQALLVHAPGNSIAGYYCYDAAGDVSELQTEAIAAEINALEFGNANHSYRWIKTSPALTESQKAATALRERLACPPARKTELVEYRDERRTLRSWQQLENPRNASGESVLRAGATYCITGNPGELGLSLCTEISRRYQANLIVAPRAPLSSQETRQLDELRRSGAKIHCLEYGGRQSFQDAVVKAAGSINNIRGVFDVGQADAPGAPMSMVEKDWKVKPLLNSATNRLKGNCLVLVNSSSADIVAKQFQAVDGKVLMVAGEDIQSPNVKTVNWADLDSGRKAAQEILTEIGAVDYVFDFSDVYKEPRSRDASQYGRIGFCQELIARFRDLTILYFTCGLQAWQSRWTTMAGARRAGFMKMLSAEYNHVRAKCIDVDSEFLASPALLSQVIAEALAAVEETEICYRQGQRFVPYLKSRRLADNSRQPQLPVRRNGAYVISGGTNGIGLEIAFYLAAQGAKNLALMGVTPLPPQGQWRSALKSSVISVYVRKKLEKLLQLQSMGVNLDVYTRRLIDRENLSAFLSGFRSKAGRIDGVVHSAGCAPDISNGKFAFINKSQADFQRVFEPKVDGLEALHEALSGETPDFFVTFSSMATMVPRFGKGLSDYAAANAFADDFISYQISQGHRYFCSMAWVGWSDVGLHKSETTPAAKDNPERRSSAVGLLFNDNQQGIDLFVAGLRDGGQRSHRMPCLLDESAFENASDTLMWAKATAPDTDRHDLKRSDLEQHPGTTSGVDYLTVLDELTQQAPLDFFVLLSPALIGKAQNTGHPYCNGFRAAFANRRNELIAAGKRRGATLALQTGPWKTSTAAKSDSSSFVPFEMQAALSLIEVALSQGSSPIALTNPHNKDAAILELLDSGSARPIASAIEKPATIGAFEQVIAKLRNAAGEARQGILLKVNLDEFSDSQIEQMYALVFDDAPKLEAEVAPAILNDTKQLHEHGISFREIKAVIDAELKSVLRLGSTAVSEQGSFQQYGLDSISGMQLVSRLEKTLGMEVPPSWLIDFSTIETLSEKIAEGRQAVIVTPVQADSESAKPEVEIAGLASVQNVSLQEIKSVIDAELKNILRLGSTAVSEQGTFQQYGLDSISGMQLVSRLEKTLGMEVPPSWLIDFSTIETLSEKISESQHSAAAASAL
jgi:3-oxoacyl-(acyl-carrier-protein) synthase/acyl carrier protein